MQLEYFLNTDATYGNLVDDISISKSLTALKTSKVLNNSTSNIINIYYLNVLPQVPTGGPPLPLSAGPAQKPR